MQTKVFLDLEQTVTTLIEDQLYSTTELIGIQKMRKFLKERNASVVSIFSFAIDNDEERMTFLNSWLRRALEEGLGVKILEVITVEEVRNAILKRRRAKFEELWEVKQLVGKEVGFLDYVRQHHKNCHCILIDDMVETSKMTFSNSGLEVEMINVDDLN